MLRPDLTAASRESARTALHWLRAHRKELAVRRYLPHLMSRLDRVIADLDATETAFAKASYAAARGLDRLPEDSRHAAP